MTKTTTLILFLCLFSSALFAGEKLVLLTSLDPNKNRPPLRSKNWNINKKLERIFYKRLTPYHTSKDQIKVIHFATINDLTRELADPENKAVFWVSHSNGSSENSAFDQNIVVDYQGKDLSEGFQNPSSHLQYLGFVGCRANYLVQRNQDKGYMSNNEHLKIYSSSKKVDARRALKRAIGNYLHHHFAGNLKDSDKACELVERQEIAIRRTLPVELKEGDEITDLKILQRDKLVGTFPKGNPGDVQEITVKLAVGKKKRDYKLVFDSGIASPQVVMGSFEVLEANYKVFSKRDGTPLGKGRYVFNLKDKVEVLPTKQLEKRTNCID